MPAYPLHKAVHLTDFGIHLRTFDPLSPEEPILYTHHDDYYTFGLVENGECLIQVDFKEYRLSKGQAFITQPNQVHRLIDTSCLVARMLVIDNALINEASRRMLGQYGLIGSPISTEQRLTELSQLFGILSRRLEAVHDENTKSLVRHLALAIVATFIDILSLKPNVTYPNQRYAELTLSFKDLLDKNLQTSRRPSHYADLMNISEGYLNEAIKNTTGVSASKMIQDEVVLQAKRQLIYTNRSVKEIALSLGFEDLAYFTRLFTKNTGISPTAFKTRYLK